MGRGLAVLGAAVVIAAGCANQINAAFAAYLTPRELLGSARYDDTTLDAVSHATRVLPDVEPVESRWSPPAGMPLRGRITSAAIPGQVSRFVARDAEIYLPPAYFADPRPELPVLVLLAGQPGTPQDWIRAGHLARTMDTFAANHRGLAPVAVIPDATGSMFADPLCLDSRLGHVDTYLSVDVPAWIRSHLTVDPDAAQWAIAGASYGGTCALQLATNHPDIYPTFVNIAGAAEPTLGDPVRTVAEAYRGDQAAFRRVDPLNLLRARRYPRSAAAIVAGVDDRDAQRDAHLLYGATTAAGMDSHVRQVPGAHDWGCFTAGLERELPWLATRMQLTA